MVHHRSFFRWSAVSAVPTLLALGCAQLSGDGVLQSAAEGRVHEECRMNPERGEPNEVEVFPGFIGEEATYVDSTTRLEFVLRNHPSGHQKALLEAIAERVGGTESAQSEPESVSARGPEQDGAVFRVPAEKIAEGAFYAVMRSVDSLERNTEARRSIEGCTNACDLPVASGESTTGFAVFAESKEHSTFPFDLSAPGARQIVAEFRQIDDAFVEHLRTSPDEARKSLADAIVEAVRAAAENTSNGAGGASTENAETAAESAKGAELKFDTLSDTIRPAYYLVWEVNASTQEKTRAVGIVINAPRISDSRLINLPETSGQEEANGSGASRNQKQICLEVRKGYYPQILLFPHFLKESPADKAAGD